MLKAGTNLGNYEIVAPIGAGGMGIVYRARHTLLGNEVALKVLLPNFNLSEKVRTRFRQEAYVQANLKHPNIVLVTDLVINEELLAIVMELVEGPSLEEVLAERPEVWSFKQVVGLMEPVLDAVAHAHERGVVHRDLKPGNVLLDRSRGRTKLGVPKVSDFGLAKILSSEMAMTRTGARMGSVPYMAPEQFEGSKNIDARADVYALGMLLWRLLTGTLPVDPDDMRAVYGLYMGQTRIPPVTDLVPTCSAQFSETIAAALSTDPNDRPSTAALLLEELERAGVEPAPAATAHAIPLSHEDTRAPSVVETPVREVPVGLETPAGFVLVPAGTFTMGSPLDEPGRDDDEVQHEVAITRPFYLQTHPVTQSQWCELMGDNPSRFSSYGDDCPVENVNWYEAIAYANARSQEEGLEECYALSGSDSRTVTFKGLHCEGYRLPTEAEWECAARAGRQTAFYNGPIIESGSGAEPNLDEIGWYCANSGDSTHPVGEKAPNAWGLYDMLGNVWEWAWDWYGGDYYEISAPQDPLGPSEGSARVGRGGSWASVARLARAAYRYKGDPRSGSFNVGFRLARSAP